MSELPVIMLGPWSGFLTVMISDSVLVCAGGGAQEPAWERGRQGEGCTRAWERGHQGEGRTTAWECDYMPMASPDSSHAIVTFSPGH